MSTQADPRYGKWAFWIDKDSKEYVVRVELLASTQGPTVATRELRWNGDGGRGETLVLPLAQAHGSLAAVLGSGIVVPTAIDLAQKLEQLVAPVDPAAVMRVSNMDLKQPAEIHRW